MAFQVTLYTNYSKRENSTKLPGQASSFILNCEANEPLNILYPTLRFKEPKGQGASVIHTEWINYCYIPRFDRYYWISEWVFEGGIWEAHCSVDPLASFRAAIGESTQYVLRSGHANVRNPYIMDNLYPVDTSTSIVETTAQFGISADEANGGGCYVVGIISGQGLVEYYYLGGNELAAFGGAMFGDTMWAAISTNNYALETEIPDFLRAQFNPLQYVVSCLWFPLQIAHASTKSDVYFGYFNSGYKAYKINRAAFTVFSEDITITKHPGGASFLNCAPFTRLKLCAGPWGEVELDTSKFANASKITLRAWADPVSGTSKLVIGLIDANTSQRKDRLMTLMGTIGTPEQLSQVLTDKMGAVANTALGIGGALAYGLAGNVGGAIQSAISGIVGAESAMMPDVSSVGSNAARISICPLTISLIHIFAGHAEWDDAQLGAPYCENTQLNSLPGYLLIANADPQIPGATKKELDSIKEFMETGFFYE